MSPAPSKRFVARVSALGGQRVEVGVVVAGDRQSLGGELLQDAGDEWLASERGSHSVVGPVAETHHVNAECLLRVFAGLGDVVSDCLQLGLQATECGRGTAEMAVALLFEQVDAFGPCRDGVLTTKVPQ